MSAKFYITSLGLFQSNTNLFGRAHYLDLNDGRGSILATIEFADPANEVEWRALEGVELLASTGRPLQKKHADHLNGKAAVHLRKLGLQEGDAIQTVADKLGSIHAGFRRHFD